jgi:hypothetical protein
MNDSISYRLKKPGEEEETFAMIDRGFNAYVRNDLTSEGVEEFDRAIRIMVFERPANHFIVVAESNSQIVGMIDVKENYNLSIFLLIPSAWARVLGVDCFPMPSCSVNRISLIVSISKCTHHH